jgi:peptidoglycan hydrolase CwlO-like protein
MVLNKNMNKLQDQIHALEERIAKLEHVLLSAQEGGASVAKTKKNLLERVPYDQGAEN